MADMGLSDYYWMASILMLRLVKFSKSLFCCREDCNLRRSWSRQVKTNVSDSVIIIFFKISLCIVLYSKCVSFSAVSYSWKPDVGACCPWCHRLHLSRHHGWLLRSWHDVRSCSGQRRWGGSREFGVCPPVSW